jgi:F-type H+-transporting ATPase subunit epsilon
MESTSMTLKILLPFKVFLETNKVSSVVIETSEGSYGFLPQRLDCVAALVPGILTYETESGKTEYVAVDAGIMVKAGTNVFISVRNALGGADLGKLGEMLKNEFKTKVENEKKESSLIVKFESEFIYSFNKFRKQ